MDYLYIFFVVTIFIAVVLLLEGVYATWNTTRGPVAKRISRRLQTMSAGAHEGRQDLSIIKKRLLSETAGAQRLLLRAPRIHLLDRLLEQSGTTLNVGQFCLWSLGMGLFTLVLLVFFHVPFLIVLPVAIAAIFVPLLFIFSKKQKRMKHIERQLPDALDLISRALRAGHALPSAIQMVGNEMAAPIAHEFRIVFDEVNYGISMKDALRNLSTRVPSTDVGYFVVAVLIQRETGGNLTEILGNIAGIIRERLKLFGQIRVFSAEGRLSAWILSLLPFCLVALLNVINPAFMKVLWTDELGRKLLAVMLGLMVIGILWMRKLIRIRV